MAQGATDLLSAIGALFSLGWRFFTEVEVPGFGVSFGVFWIAVLLMGFSIRVLSVMLGTHVFKLDATRLPTPKSRPFGFRVE